MARQKDFWDKLPTAKSTKGGVHFEKDHHFYVTIGDVIDKDDGRDDDYFIIEAQVIESTCEKQGEGFCASQVIALSNDPAPGNVANFLRAAYTALSRQGPDSGFDEPLDPEDDDDWTDMKLKYEVATGEDQLVSGMKIYLKTKGIITDKGKGHPFTIHDWSADKPDTWPTEAEE